MKLFYYCTLDTFGMILESYVYEYTDIRVCVINVQLSEKTFVLSLCIFFNVLVTLIFRQFFCFFFLSINRVAGT